MMQMGFAQCRITPDIPCQLAGYDALRQGEGVHDELFARAIALRNGENTVVLLQLDALNVDGLFMGRLEARLGEIGLEKEQLLVFCTHTHSSFGGILDVSHGLNTQLKNLMGEQNDALLDMVISRSVRVMGEALGDMGETRIRMLRDTVSGVATNRHSPNDPSDQSIFVLEFTRADGKKVLLYNLCCHPTVLDRNNKLLSADFYGYTNRFLQDQCDMAVFINGSAGDMSTRFTRRESSFAECRRIGEIVGAKVAEMLKNEDQPVPLEKAGLRYHTIYLKEAAVDNPDDAARKLAAAEENLRAVMARTGDAAVIRKAESFVEGAAVNHLKARFLQGGKAPSQIPVQVGILTLNGQRIVCSPFELFSVLALRLKEQAPVEMFGYSNVLQGYLGDTAAYENQDYEALFSTFAAGEGEHYICEVLELLNKTK